MFIPFNWSLATFVSVLLHGVLIGFLSFGAIELDEKQESRISIKADLFRSADLESGSQIGVEKTTNKFSPEQASPSKQLVSENALIRNASTSKILKTEVNSTAVLPKDQTDIRQRAEAENIAEAKSNTLTTTSAPEIATSVTDVIIAESNSEKTVEVDQLALLIVPEDSQIKIEQTDAQLITPTTEIIDEVQPSPLTLEIETTESKILRELPKEKVEQSNTVKIATTEVSSSVVGTPTPTLNATNRVSSGKILSAKPTRLAKLKSVTSTKSQTVKRSKTIVISSSPSKTSNSLAQKSPSLLPADTQNKNQEKTETPDIQVSKNVTVIKSNKKTIILTNGKAENVTGMGGKGLLKTQAGGTLSNQKVQGIIPKAESVTRLVEEDKLILPAAESERKSLNAGISSLSGAVSTQLTGIESQELQIAEIAQMFNQDVVTEITIPELSSSAALVSTASNLSAQSSVLQKSDSNLRLDANRSEKRIAALPDATDKRRENSDSEKAQNRIQLNEVQLAVNKFMGGMYGELSKCQFYPDAARSSKLEGKVLVQYTVKSNGQLENLEVVQSGGHALLDQAALDTLRCAAPFDSLPDKLNKKKLTFKLPIVFEKQE